MANPAVKSLITTVAARAQCSLTRTTSTASNLATMKKWPINTMSRTSLKKSARPTMTPWQDKREAAQTRSQAQNVGDQTPSLGNRLREASLPSSNTRLEALWRMMKACQRSKLTLRITLLLTSLLPILQRKRAHETLTKRRRKCAS